MGTLKQHCGRFRWAKEQLSTGAVLILGCGFLYLPFLRCDERSVDNGSANTNRMFSFIVKETSEGKWDVIFKNAPSNFVALPPAPQELDNQLKSGKWLVILFSSFGTRDRLAVHQTIPCLAGHEKNLKVGFRAFWDYDENNKWFPDYESPYSPYWIIFKDGKVVSYKSNGDFRNKETEKWSDEMFRSWLNAVTVHGVSMKKNVFLALRRYD